MNTTKQVRWCLLAIMVLAFGLRLLANGMFEGLHSGPSRKGFGSDAIEFNAIAVNLATHGEYSITQGSPTSWRAPGFPFALAGIYAVSGANNFLAVRLFSSIIGALLCLVVYFLARDVANQWLGLLAALFVAVYPNVLYYSIHFSSEPLFTLLLILATWLVLRACTHNCLTDYVISGLVLGLAALTRPIAFYYGPLFVVAIVWLGRQQLTRSIWVSAIFLLGLLLPIIPWAIRNYHVHDRWLLFASIGGETFWGANNEIVLNTPAYHGAWISTRKIGEQNTDVTESHNEVDKDRLRLEHGKQFIREHLRDLPRLTWYKLVELWTPLCKTPNHQFNLIIGLSYGAAIPFMLWGFWLFVRAPHRQSGEILILLTPIIGTILSSLIFYGCARFRSPIEPILLIFAAIAIIRLLPNIPPRQASDTPHP